MEIFSSPTFRTVVVGATLLGVVAGVAYGWMLLRTRDIWAVAIAHAITNGLLGIYVVWAEKWQFWS